MGRFLLSTVTITDSTISDNSAIYQGAGLHLDGSVVTIERSLISGNTVTNNSGPVYVGAASTTAPPTTKSTRTSLAAN